MLFRSAVAARRISLHYLVYWARNHKVPRVEEDMPADWPPQFLFAVCQCGAEQVLKQEIAAGPVDARPAYSRPGFVTFKLGKPCENPEQFQLPSTFARTYGFCLGKVVGDRMGELARQVWQSPAVEQILASHPISDLHVWQRDRKPPGMQGFEPGPTILAGEIEAALRECSHIAEIKKMPDDPRPPSRRNRWVFDIVCCTNYDIFRMPRFMWIHPRRRGKPIIG